jgi:thiol-disulfide isomerase/thioredoxin
MSSERTASIWIVLFALCAGALGFAAGLRFMGDTGFRGAAPEFVLEDAASGASVSLHSLRGKPILLNFWASWCPPCVEEIPLLEALQKRRPDLVVLGIAEEPQADAMGFLEQRPIQYRVLVGARDVSSMFGNSRRVLPFTALIDAQGNVVDTHVGAFNERALTAFLREAGL